MQYRSLGKSGLLVSTIAIGTSNFARTTSQEEARAIVDRALDLGITLFDTAEAYNAGRSEEFLCAALGSRRKDVLIASKFGNHLVVGPEKWAGYRGGSRHEIMKAVESSLRRLKTDYLDLYQMHRPDFETPVDETVRALDDLVRQGKVRYIGASNIPAWMMAELQLVARHVGQNAFVSCQDEYNLLTREKFDEALMPMIQRHGLGMLPYSPLARGMLTGKYRRDQPFPEGSRFAVRGSAPAQFQRHRETYTTERSWDRLERLREFAVGRSRSMLELALSWPLAQPNVTAIVVGAASPDQLDQNVEATSWILTAEELSEVDRITAET